jgi:hypothetical protein
VSVNYSTLCVDPLVIAPLMASLDAGGTYTGNCDGNTWRYVDHLLLRVWCIILPSPPLSAASISHAGC